MEIVLLTTTTNNNGHSYTPAVLEEAARQINEKAIPVVSRIRQSGVVGLRDIIGSCVSARVEGNMLLAEIDALEVTPDAFGKVDEDGVVQVEEYDMHSVCVSTKGTQQPAQDV